MLSPQVTKCRYCTCVSIPEVRYWLLATSVYFILDSGYASSQGLALDQVLGIITDRKMQRGCSLRSRKAK